MKVQFEKILFEKYASASDSRKISPAKTPRYMVYILTRAVLKCFLLG